jgi:hypothetical protein
VVDQATDVTGASLRKIGGAKFLVITLKDAFVGAPPTIFGLSQFAHLPLEQTFDELLRFTSNAAAVRSLFNQQIGGAMPSLAAARAQLRKAGHVFTATGAGTQIYATQTPYESWGVSQTEVKAVVLSLSSAFKEVMRAAKEQHERDFRLRVNQPVFDQLKKDLDQIFKTTLLLDNAIGGLKRFVDGNARELAILELLTALLNAMVEHPKDPSDKKPLDGGDGLQDRLAKLKAAANKALILDPPQSTSAKERDQFAQQLKDTLHDQGFKDRLQKMVDNRDVVPADLWSNAMDTLRSATTTALGSNQADAFIDGDILPMIDAVASQPIDLTGISIPSRPDLDAAIKQAPPAPAQGLSYLTIIAGVIGMKPLVSGNVPGPSALAVGVVQMAAPIIMSRLVGNVPDAATFFGKAYRFFVKCAGMTPKEEASLAEAVELAQSAGVNRALAVVRQDIDWTAKFMTEPGWGAAIGFANALCFIAAIDSDDSNTVRKWANIIGSGSGTVLGIAVTFQNFSNLLKAGIVKGVGGKVLGVIGGIAVVFAGAESIKESAAVNDNVGIGIGVATVAGGLLSVAGFLCTAGLATDATGVGLPVGTFLMICGAVLGIGAGIAGLIQSITTSGTQLVFDSYLQEFGRTDGPFQKTALFDSTLTDKFKAVQDHSVWHFWTVDPGQQDNLLKIGFTQDAVDHIIHANILP